MFDKYSVHLVQYSVHLVQYSSISMEKMEKTSKNRYNHLD
jgi:hypothetical protein